MWIGLHDPSAESGRARSRPHFELHPLAVEDAVHAHQRPKLERLRRHALRRAEDRVATSTARSSHRDRRDHGLRRPGFVVTVRHGEASPLHDVRARPRGAPRPAGHGPTPVLYAIADRVVDDYLDGHRRHRRRTSRRSRPRSSPAARTDPAERIYHLKREVLEFRARSAARRAAAAPAQRRLPLEIRHRGAHLLPRRRRPPAARRRSASRASTNC